MALPRGCDTNETGIDPGADTYLTEIRAVEERTGPEAMGNTGAFQEAARVRTKTTYTLKGYGEPSAVPGLNSLTEVDDGPFIQSVQYDQENEQLDMFEVVGYEYAA